MDFFLREMLEDVNARSGADDDEVKGRTVLGRRVRVVERGRAPEAVELRNAERRSALARFCDFMMKRIDNRSFR